MLHIFQIKNTAKKRNSCTLGEIPLNFDSQTRILENDEGAFLSGPSRIFSYGKEMPKHRLPVKQMISVEYEEDFPSLGDGQRKRKV